MAKKPQRTPHDPSKPLGHRNPPKETQFKKGNPGGPGRPKGVMSIDAVFGKMFGGRVPVTENGKRVTKSMGEAIARRGQQITLTGSPNAFLQMLGFYEKYANPSTSGIGLDKMVNINCLTHELRVIFILILDKMMAYHGKEEGESVVPTDFDFIDDILGTWEFFIGEDGHIAAQRRS